MNIREKNTGCRFNQANIPFSIWADETMMRMTLIAMINRTAKTIPPLITSWTPISRLHTFINEIMENSENKYIGIYCRKKSVVFRIFAIISVCRVIGNHPARRLCIGRICSTDYISAVSSCTNFIYEEESRNTNDICCLKCHLCHQDHTRNCTAQVVMHPTANHVILRKKNLI